MLRTAYQSNQTGDVEFKTWGSLDDMTLSASGYTGVNSKEFIVRIATEGTPDQISFSSDNETSWSTPADITGSAQTLAEGVQVSFGATTGHSLGDEWRFAVCPSLGGEKLRVYVAALTDFDVLNSLVSSLNSLGKNPTKSWTTYKSEITAVMTAVIANIGGNLNDFLTTNTMYVNAEIRDIASVTAERVIPKPVVLGEFVYSGDAAGTWTQRDSVDVSKYGAAQLELVAMSSITGAGAGIATLDGEDFAGSAINKTGASVCGAMSQYDIYDVSSDYTERFSAVTAITVTGGANGEKFILRTQEDNLPIL